MPPNQTDQILEIPLPVKGLNTDSFDGPAGYAQQLVNFIPGEPGVLRQRNSWKWVANFGASLSGNPNGWKFNNSTKAFDGTFSAVTWIPSRVIPIGCVVYGDYAIITLIQNMEWNSWAVGVPSGAPAPSYTSGSDAQVKIVIVSLSGNAAIAQDPALVTSGQWWMNTSMPEYLANNITMAFGPTAYLEDRVFWVQPQLAGMTNWSGNQGRLMCWGGAIPDPSQGSAFNAAQELNISANIAVGATSFSLAAGAPLTALTSVVNSTVAPGGLLVRASSSTGNESVAETPNRFIYRIERVSGTTVYLNRPWGKGVAGAADLASGALMRARTTYGVMYAPRAARCVNTFAGRLFTGGGTKAGFTGDAYHTVCFDRIIQWSREGNPDSWPTTNYIYLEDCGNEQITALQTVGDVQLIHTNYHSFVMSGYDEDSFSIRPLATGGGCIDPRATTTIAGRVYWLSEQGVMSWDGSSRPQIESHRSPGIGVSSRIKDQLSANVNNVVTATMRSPALGSNGNMLLVTTNMNSRDRSTVSSQPARQDWAMGLNTSDGTWALWGVDQALQGNIMLATPYLFANQANGRCLAILPYDVVDISGCWAPQHSHTSPTYQSLVTDPPPSNVYSSSTDSLFNGTAWVNYPMTAIYTSVPIQPKRGTTVRLSEFEIDYHSEGLAADLPAANVYLSSDLDFTNTTSNTDRLQGTLRTAIYNDQYVDTGRFQTTRFDLQSSSVSLDSARYRVRIVRSGATQPNVWRLKLHGIYAKMSVVRNFRAQ